jgi:hypothetical protein
VIYTIERANLLAAQFQRFKSSHSHHLAGLFANLDFWLEEVEASYRIIDQYQERFTRLRQAQEDWVENHDSKEYRYCPICEGQCEFDDGTPPSPHRTSSADLLTRHDLREAARSFLLRGYRAGILDEDQLHETCTRIGTGVEPSELQRHLDLRRLP